MTQHLFFDLDGTLTDPQEGITRSIVYALDQFGVEHRQDLSWCIGPPLRASFVQLVGEQRADEAVGYYRERFAAVGWQENRVYSGIPQLLTALLNHGCSLHVATSKPHIYAAKILEHFALMGYFQTVFGSELDGTRTDKTELLAYAKTRLALDSGIMVGDRRHDMMGARNNGLGAVGVSYGYGTVDEVTQAGGQQIAASPDELLGLLRSHR